MIVSWNWLRRYLDLNGLSDAQVAERLSLSGLNHESTKVLEGDWSIDLEVTSNRPDCLAHIGVAREIGVLFDRTLNLPQPNPKAAGPAVDSLAAVEIQCPNLCPRYTARLIQGVKIGPSPTWLQELLANASDNPLEFKSINNVADITNFVMKECGQPLHAFDFDLLSGNTIIVRQAKAGEILQAIDHKEYALTEEMCVIADAQRPVALAGIMGGASTEISDRTVNVLIEAADFAPGSIRQTSRKLKLGSDSSYRFERTVDPQGIDWASRRCCELILECCGGQLCEGVIDIGAQPEAREPIRFRIDQIARVLGIEVEAESVERILRALGNHVDTAQLKSQRSMIVTPPSWRRDLGREADLIEEVARIHGYDQIPEDHAVPMAVSSTTPHDLSCHRIRHVLTAAGFSEALSPSLVPAVISELYSPWTALPSLTTLQPMLGVLDTKFWNAAGPVDCARRSLIPSLLELRRINEFRHHLPVELFEIAKIYLPQENYPLEPTMIGICSGRDLLTVKSVVSQVFHSINRDLEVQVETRADAFFSPGKAIQYSSQGKVLGILGEISLGTQKKLKLKDGCVVGEFFLESLVEALCVIPQAQRQSLFPAIERDFNFILDMSVRWADLERTVREAGSQLLESVVYRETYIDKARDGEGKKRVLLTLTLRSLDQTLTGKQADDVCGDIVEHCQRKLHASLVTA